MFLDKVADVSIHHPVRYHGKLVPGHHHSDERQDIWMMEGLPHYDLLAELLSRWYILSTTWYSTPYLKGMVGLVAEKVRGEKKKQLDYLV